jgi:hypothetical protein
MIGSWRDTTSTLGALSVYQASVLPRVRHELGGWREVAATIPDLDPRRTALGAIEEKGLNVEAISVFAILAPRRTRATATRAMVALQIAIDYLDTLGEEDVAGDAAYLDRLFAAYEAAARALPTHGAVAAPLDRAVARCGEGQHHTHMAEHGNPAALEAWARAEEAPAIYRWWEVAAGASSSVAAHALIAAAADPRTTATEAALTDAAYFPPVGALTVLLDDLIDRGEDAATGAHNYLAYYADSEDAAARLELITHLGRAATAKLRRPHRHAAILAGVAGFYLSAPEAETAYARPVRDRLLTATGPAVRPIVSLMRWRRRDDPEAAASGP